MLNASFRCSTQQRGTLPRHRIDVGAAGASATGMAILEGWVYDLIDQPPSVAIVLRTFAKNRIDLRQTHSARSGYCCFAFHMTGVVVPSASVAICSPREQPIAVAMVAMVAMVAHFPTSSWWPHLSLHYSGTR
jgi:hypothetical protein